MAMVNNVPDDWTLSAFSLGRDQMAYVAAAVLAGGNVRVGLEDNLWLDKGVLATNAQLVERAVTIIENIGARVIGPDEVRDETRASPSGRRRHERAAAQRVLITGGGGGIGLGLAEAFAARGDRVAICDADPAAVAHARRRPARGQHRASGRRDRRGGDGGLPRPRSRPTGAGSTWSAPMPAPAAPRGGSKTSTTTTGRPASPPTCTAPSSPAAGPRG